MLEVWMILIGVSMSIGGLPQAARIWKRKASGDVSVLMWLIMIHGIVWWLYYGIVIGSLCLIVTNSICLLIDVPVLMMVLKYRKESPCLIDRTQRTEQ